MFMPPELTRMMNEDPAAFDALMKQRGAESEQSWNNMTQGTEIGKKLEEQFGGGWNNKAQGPGPGRRTTIAHPDHPLMGGPGFDPRVATDGPGAWGQGIPGKFPAPVPGPGVGTGAMTQGPAGQRQGQRLEQQAPRPEGFQRVATGIADWLTGNNWDFDQRGTGAKFLNEITKVGKDPNGNTFSDHVPNMKAVPPIDPLKVLGQSPTFGGGGAALGQGTGGLQPDDPRILMEETFGGGKRYNPFEGQFITLPDGRVVPRTPENSVPGP